jgi:transcriptional regulator with XRE-family HTH domain
MILGERIRLFREAKDLSQGDVEDRTGLRCCYISRVERGRTVPSLETLEKFARALGIQVYQFFVRLEGQTDNHETRATNRHSSLAARTKEERDIERFRVLLAKMPESRRSLLLLMALQLAKRK